MKVRARSNTRTPPTPAPPAAPLAAADFLTFETVVFGAYRSLRPKSEHVLTVVTRFDTQPATDFSVRFQAEDPAGCVAALRILADYLETRCLPEQAVARLFSGRIVPPRRPPKRAPRRGKP